MHFEFSAKMEREHSQNAYVPMSNIDHSRPDKAADAFCIPMLARHRTFIEA
jgi:hypothetical protein